MRKQEKAEKTEKIEMQRELKVFIVPSRPHIAFYSLNIDFNYNPELREQMDSFRKKGIRLFILDFYQCTYLNSGTLGYLLLFQEDLFKEQMHCVLARVHSKILVLFELLSLSPLFRLYSTLVETMSSLHLDFQFLNTLVSSTSLKSSLQRWNELKRQGNSEIEMLHFIENTQNPELLTQEFLGFLKNMLEHCEWDLFLYALYQLLLMSYKFPQEILPFLLSCYLQTSREELRLELFSLFKILPVDPLFYALERVPQEEQGTRYFELSKEIHYYFN